MNLPIETLNDWAEHALGFAWPMLWQSSLLIGVLFALDWLLKRKLRPAVRYTLWLAVLIKLLLPPSLAVPTSAAWWLRPAKAAPAVPRPAAVIVTYSTMDRLPAPATALPLVVPAPIPRLTWAAAMFLGAVGVSFGLLSWMLRRWQQVARDARRAAPAPDRLGELLSGRRRPLRLRLTDRPQSPAVCGLFRPVILLPRSLAGQLPPAQLRAVLLHELIHLRRGDVWVNCAQALLQIVYWWHPLLWLANARIRRLREEAVDDAVMVALKDEADTYAPTLLEVAKLALPRPLASLGLVGILESCNSLRQRIERLMDFRPPRRAGLTLTSALGVLSFAALAVPMGETPAPTAGPGAIASQSEADRRTTETLLAAGSPATNQPLYVRTFKIDQNTLIKGLRKETGSTGTNLIEAVTPALRDFLLQAGVDLDPVKHPGKALFYKDRQGMLMVRATMEDLDTIEAVISLMHSTPPQIMVQACFIEVSEKEASKAWNSLAAAGTAPNGTKFAVLTTSQAAAVRKQLAPPGNTNVLATPRVVTLSARQAQAQVATVQKIVTGINPCALTPPGITVANEDESLMLATESLSIGIALDVIPCLMGKDDYTLSITAIPTVTEFLGYADPGTNRVAVYVNGRQKWISEPRPNVRQRQMIATAQVWDGQTLMLGNPKLVTPGALKIAAKPGESSGDGRKRLIVLVTPTLVDSAGNRVHTDDEMPFAREGIPAQPAR